MGVALWTTAAGSGGARLASVGMVWSVPGFTVERRLGAGSTGEVWRGIEDATGEPVALKRLRPGQEDGSRLRREGAVLAAFRHPHVVAVRALLSTGSGAVLVLELAGGGSLASAVGRVGRLRCGEVVAALAPIADALAAAHEAGLVHGDVSLGNILLTSTGVPLLADLGTARLVGDDRPPVRATPGYVDPAVQAGGVPNPASDVYGLAAVAVRCLLGGTGPSAAVGPPPGWAGRAFGQGVPATLVAALAAGLDREPGRRPGAGELAEALRATCGPLRLDRLLPGAASAPGAGSGFASDSAGAGPLPAEFTLPVGDDPWRPLGAPFEAEHLAAAGRRRLLAALAALAALALLAVGWAAWPAGWSLGAPAPGAHPSTDRTASSVQAASPARSLVPRAASPALSLAGWRKLLAEFDLRRAAAFAGPEAGPLADVYVRGSRPYQADLRSVRALAAGRVRAVGVRHDRTAVAVHGVRAGRVGVRAVDQAMAYQVVDAAGGGLTTTVPRRPAASVEFSLVATVLGWRIAAITAVDVASPAPGGTAAR